MRINGEKVDLSVPLGFLIALPSGGIAVADPLEFRVRFFNDSGRLVRDAGRRGGGPGEFADPGGGSRGARIQGGRVGDSLWVYDWGSRRTTFLSFGGKVLGTVALPATLPILNGARGGGRPKPVETGPVSFELSAIYNDGSMLGTATFGSVTRDPGGAVRGSRTEIGRMSSDARTFRSFAANLETPHFVSVTNPKGLVQSFWVPFASSGQTHHAVAADGNRFALLSMGPDATGAASVSLTVIGANGDTIVDRRYRVDAERVTPAMADDAVSRMVAELARPLPDGSVTIESGFANEVKRKLRSAVPAFRSPFKALAIGTDNSIWVLQEITKDTTPWLIFRPNGELFGRLALSKGFRLIAERSLKQAWMIGSDKDGFAIVSRFRIEPK